MKLKFIFSIIGILFFNKNILYASNLYQFDLEESKKGAPHFYEIQDPLHPHHAKRYILGTQHNLPFNLVQKIVQYSIPKCEIFVGEVNNESWYMGNFSHLTLEELTESGLYSEKFQDWPVHLSQEEKDFLDEKVLPNLNYLWGITYNNLCPQLLEKVLKTWMLGSAWSAAQGMDSILTDIFAFHEKPILGLENGTDRLKANGTIEECLSADIPYSIYQLRQAIYNYKSQIEEISEPVSLSFKTDKKVEDFKFYFSEQAYGQSSLPNSAVKERNHLWLPRMEKIMMDYPDQSIAFIVGVGHFKSEYSVLKLLEHQGYRVTRFKQNGLPNPSLNNFCAYTADTIYIDMVKMAAKRTILEKTYGPNLTISEEELQAHLLKDYNFFIKYATQFMQNAQVTDFGYADFERFRRLVKELNNYDFSDYSTVLQSENREYNSELLMSKDLNYALGKIIKNASQALNNFR